MQPVYIVFGTESGNAQGLADRAEEALEREGLSCKAVDMLDLAHDSVPELRFLLVITSTYGNGDPPSNAEALHAWLMKKAPPLPNVHFSVCGLGDTTYERFAQCGKDFDKRLAELGATRIFPRQDCDVDYEAPFETWLAGVIPELQKLKDAALAEPPLTSPPPEPQPVSKHIDAPGTRRNPVAARILVNQNLNGAASTKETRHVALSLLETPIRYEVGDSIGVWPKNDRRLVEEILRLTHLGADEVVTAFGEETTLVELLSQKVEIQEPDARLVERVLGTKTAGERTAEARTHHVLDLLSEGTPQTWTANELAHHLRPLAPRLYSIASSPLAHPSEVHLLMDVVRYELKGRARMGVTSRFVTEHSAPGESLSIYLHAAPGFRLPAPDRDIVMIGPGTGVAPYRAFVEHRRATKATGRNWLFFGARNRATDFFYEEDFTRFEKDGTLHRLDVAFSRDQPQKIYVQDRMRQSAEELAAFIRGGAFVYVCGDAKRMAPDVHAALGEILGRADLESLANDGRYLRDVY